MSVRPYSPARGLEADTGLPEGVAGLQISGLHPGLEPGDALGARAVGEALRRHVAAGLALQPIVPDRGRRGEPRVDVLRMDQLLVVVRLVGGVGVVGPHAGIAVRLELGEDAERVAVLAVSDAPAHLRDPPLDAEQVLDVVPDLVGDDVRAREVAGRAHPAELAE